MAYCEQHSVIKERLKFHTHEDQTGYCIPHGPKLQRQQLDWTHYWRRKKRAEFKNKLLYATKMSGVLTYIYLLVILSLYFRRTETCGFPLPVHILLSSKSTQKGFLPLSRVPNESLFFPLPDHGLVCQETNLHWGTSLYLWDTDATEVHPLSKFFKNVRLT